MEPMMRRWLVGAVMAASCAGCGGDGDTTVVDPHAATFGATRLGQTAADVRHALGTPLEQGPMLRTLPEGTDPDDIGTPWVIPAPTDIRSVTVLRYSDTTVLVSPRDGAYAVLGWGDGAETQDGVGVGDSLAAARRRYRGLRCAVRNDGTEHPSYPYCTARIGGLYVWFGQDPIKSISLSRVPLA
jgi:hypothetical protein